MIIDIHTHVPPESDWPLFLQHCRDNGVTLAVTSIPNRLPSMMFFRVMISVFRSPAARAKTSSTATAESRIGVMDSR